MQRYGFRRLYAWLISIHLVACIRIFAQGRTTEASASPILTFVAITLFLILTILEIDLHRDELSALGLVAGEEGVVLSLVRP